MAMRFLIWRGAKSLRACPDPFTLTNMFLTNLKRNSLKGAETQSGLGLYAK